MDRKSFVQQPMTRVFVRPPPMKHGEGYVGLYESIETPILDPAINLLFWKIGGLRGPMSMNDMKRIRYYHFIDDALAGWEMLKQGASLQDVANALHGPVMPPEVKPIGRIAHRRRRIGAPDPLSWL